ncbi:MAG: lysophospholipid acyltransferase family protein [Candidatus Wallbacteria bacterium]|nr:lysophospholipid acyltransferase family protein [Candidatus Wallbacteria bacterium]
MDLFFTRLLTGLGILLRRTPLWLHHFIARVVAGFVIIANLKRFMLAQRNLKLIFSANSRLANFRTAWKSYLNLSFVLLEFLQIPALDKGTIKKRFAFKGLENFRNALSGGRGVLLLTAHFGNWEILGQALVLLGFPLSSIVKTQKHGRLDNRINQFRACHGMEVITKGFGLREAVLALKRNRILGILLDQDAKDQGLMVPFLGLPASTPASISALHQRYGSPIIPTFIIREGYFKFRVMIGEPLRTEGMDQETILRTCNDEISGIVREYPEQWLWLHNRWRTKL